MISRARLVSRLPFADVGPIWMMPLSRLRQKGVILDPERYAHRPTLVLEQENDGANDSQQTTFPHQSAITTISTVPPTMPMDQYSSTSSSSHLPLTQVSEQVDVNDLARLSDGETE